MLDTLSWPVVGTGATGGKDPPPQFQKQAKNVVFSYQSYSNLLFSFPGSFNKQVHALDRLPSQLAFKRRQLHGTTPIDPHSGTLPPRLWRLFRHFYTSVATMKLKHAKEIVEDIVPGVVTFNQGLK